MRIRTILGTIEEPTSGLAGFPSHSTPRLDQAASKPPQKVQLVLRGTKVREGRAGPQHPLKQPADLWAPEEYQPQPSLMPASA